MSTPTFDPAAHPRMGDGKFAVKTLSDAGTDADLGPNTHLDPSWMRCENIALDQAPAWQRAGFEADEADDWARVGAGIDDAIDYTSIGSSPDDVVNWREHGFNDGASARKWVQEGNPAPPRSIEGPEPIEADGPAQEEDYKSYSSMSSKEFNELLDEYDEEDRAWREDISQLRASLPRY